MNGRGYNLGCHRYSLASFDTVVQSNVSNGYAIYDIFLA